MSASVFSSGSMKKCGKFVNPADGTARGRETGAAPGMVRTGPKRIAGMRREGAVSLKKEGPRGIL